MERVDVVVIGAGIVGLSAAWRLAEAGQDVLVLEQFEPGHDRGSSHGPTRIFRLAYDDPVYVRLAQQALPLWRELEGAIGAELLRITGGIDVGDPAYLEARSAALRSCGASAQHIGPSARRDRFPWLNAGDEGCIFSPATGVLFARDALRAASDAARASGARIVYSSRCDRLAVKDDQVEVATGGQTVGARFGVVAAGPWMASVVEPLDVSLPLRVTREQVFYFRASEEVIPFIHRGSVTRYGVPALGGAPGVKVAEHGTGVPTSADARTFEEDPAGRARLVGYVRRALPSFDPEPVSFETCLYTNTPDEGFILDRRGPVLIASTCSGHGFKFGPIVGELVARMVTG